MIDAYVNPVGLAHFGMNQKHDVFGIKNASCAYVSLSLFSVTLKDAEGAKVIMSRDGLDWRVTNLLMTDMLTASMKRNRVESPPETH